MIILNGVTGSKGLNISDWGEPSVAIGDVIEVLLIGAIKERKKWNKAMRCGVAIERREAK